MQDLKQYLTSEIKDFLFTELDSGFLAANDLGCLESVPIPISSADLKSFTDGGLSTTKLADNMAVVLGADPGFKYADSYLSYLHRLFSGKLAGVFATKAEDLLQKESYRSALCYLRAALLFDPESLQANYCYANGCRLWYQSMEGEDREELIALLKAEANGYFSLVTDKYPEFAPGWYFLGYAYLNAGQYTKAQLAFQHYMKNSKGQPEEDVKEVQERLDALKDPVRLEEGKNLLVAGRIEEALQILEPYVESPYGRWWPLHFYLATAYYQLEYYEVAAEGFLKVLELNPSNYDAMMSLSVIYEILGDSENASKYAKKAQLVLKNAQEEM